MDKDKILESIKGLMPIGVELYKKGGNAYLYFIKNETDLNNFVSILNYSKCNECIIFTPDILYEGVVNEDLVKFLFEYEEDIQELVCNFDEMEVYNLDSMSDILLHFKVYKDRKVWIFKKGATINEFFNY